MSRRLANTGESRDTVIVMQAKNDLLETMRRSEIAFGLLVRQARTVDIGKAMAQCGLSWLFLDLEHNTMELGTAVQISIAAQDSGVTPIVRVPKGEFGLACRLLDGGAMGVIMPNVQNAAEAVRFVAACRYWPLGARSFAGTLPHTGFKPMTTREMLEKVDPITALFAMVESRAGAENAEEIIATPGIDGLFLGIQDLSIDLGVPGETGHPAVRDVIRSTIEACRKHRKFVGIAGIGDAAQLKECLAQGCNFAIVGNDLNLLMQAVTRRLADIRLSG